MVSFLLGMDTFRFIELKKKLPASKFSFKEAWFLDRNLAILHKGGSYKENLRCPWQGIFSIVLFINLHMNNHVSYGEVMHLWNWRIIIYFLIF